MINVLVPVTEKPEKFLQAVSAVCQDVNVQLIIGVTQAISEKFDFNVPNAILIVYPNDTNREQMINSFQEKLLGEGVFIARKPFTKEEFYNFTNQDAQIVVCKQKPKNKLSALLYAFWCYIVKNVFGVKFFEGDTSLIYFEKSQGSVLANINNLSYSTRIDRWKAVKHTSVATSEPAVKPIVDKHQQTILLLSAIFAITFASVVTILVAFLTNISIITGLLLACLDTICVIIFALLLITIFFNRKIGKKDFKNKGV